MTNAELDKDMIESIEMWLHEIKPKWVEKELNWLKELRSRLLESVEEAAEKEYPCDKSCMTPDMLDLNAHKQVAFRKGAKWDREQIWLDFRREAAKDVLCAIIQLKGMSPCYIDEAITYADELIKQLKEDKK